MEKNKELEQFKKTITEDEAQAIKDKRNYDKYFLADERYRKLAVLSDSTYDGFIERQALIKHNTAIILAYKQIITKNKIELMKGETDRKDKYGNPLLMKDLEIENYNTEIELSNQMAKLRKNANHLFKYIGINRLDGTPIITEADLWRFLSDIETKLEKEGLSMFEEKVL